MTVIVDSRAGAMVRATGAVSSGGNGTVHLVGGWRPCGQYGPGRFYVEWLCGQSCAAPFLVEAEPSCKGCGHAWLGIELGHVWDSSSVYFAAADGLIKIGVSNSPGLRARGLRATLLAVARVPEGMTRTFFERQCHDEFAEYRCKGEWFTPAQRIVDRINDLRTLAGHTPIDLSSVAA